MWVCVLALLLASSCGATTAPQGTADAPRTVPKIQAHSPRVQELDSFTFLPAIKDPSRLTFVEFYVHDCRGCKRLAPIWDDLAESCAPWHDVLIARLDCEAAEAVCDRSNVAHTPTLKLYHNGTEVVTYKADVYHIDLLRPFMAKMRQKYLVNTGGAAEAGPNGRVTAGEQCGAHKTDSCESPASRASHATGEL